MSWMFRWLEHLVARLAPTRGEGDGWVEPSNAITRAVIANAVASLPDFSAGPMTTQEAAPAEAAAPAEEAAASASRPRRRRSARAA